MDPPRRSPGASRERLHSPKGQLDGTGFAIAPVDGSTGAVRFAIRVNIAGTRKRESSVDDVSPPTTVSASGWFASVPRSRPVAVGTSPMIVARLVIAIGMNRMGAD